MPVTHDGRSLADQHILEVPPNVAIFSRDRRGDLNPNMDKLEFMCLGKVEVEELCPTEVAAMRENQNEIFGNLERRDARKKGGREPQTCLTSRWS